MTHPLIRAQSVVRTFSRRHAGDIHVLRHLDLEVCAGQSHAILGKSGSGKSTLIHLLAGFDHPTSGKIFWRGEDASSLSLSHIDRARRKMFGFVHQHHHLMSDLSALDNVSMPLRIDGVGKAQARIQAGKWLERVGLSGRGSHMPGELSGGERQRVGIARALANHPAVVIADEPTGNLDRETGAQIFGLLEVLRRETGTAMIVVTHDMSVADRSQFRWSLEDGRLTALPTASIHPFSSTGSKPSARKLRSLGPVG